MIDANLTVAQANFTLQAAFHTKGRVVALFGPSGAGKTTVLQAIAGLVKAEGHVAVAGELLADSRQGLALSTQARRIGYVFQEGRLFPHLSVRQNLLYGQRFTANKVPLEPVVELLGLKALLERRPRQLSGGEQQRVAIGRALLCRPRMLLLDEPLAALDQARKAEILPYLARLRDEVKLPILYVSHAIEEAAQLADDLVVLREGRVLAAGPLAQVLAQSDVAPLTGGFDLGMPLSAKLVQQLDGEGLSRLEVAAGELFLPRIAAPLGSLVGLRVRPRDITLSLKRPEGLSALNILSAQVTALTSLNDASVEVTLDCHGAVLKARITHRSRAALKLQEGQALYAVIKSLAFDRRHLEG